MVSICGISDYTEDPLPAKVVFASIWDLPPTDNFSWLLKIVQDAYDVVSGEVDDVEINNNTPVPIVSIHCSLKQMPRVYTLLADYVKDWDVPTLLGLLWSRGLLNQNRTPQPKTNFTHTTRRVVAPYTVIF